MKTSEPVPFRTAPATRTRATQDPASPATGALADALAGSPRLTAQRQRIEAGFGSAVQREGLEDDELQRKALQRQDEEEEPLQGRGIVQRMDGLEEEEPLQSRTADPNRTGMPDDLKTGIESLSGMDLSDVRVHRDSAEPARVDALATAQGRDIHLAPGQEQHLPHEAWHVVQQAQGRVQPTVQLEGVPVNDDAALEQEADRMGAQAMQSVPR